MNLEDEINEKQKIASDIKWLLQLFTNPFIGTEKYVYNEIAYQKDIVCHKIENYLKLKGEYKVKKQDLVREEMIKAMKEKNKPKKETLSLLLAALKNAEIDKMRVLSPEEEDAVVQKEIKQTKETLEMTPADRTDIIQQCNNRLAVLQQFAPQMMNEAEIEKVISDVLKDLELDNPTKREKGKIMKVLMPQVKGKADGKLVNQILERKLA